MLTHSDKEDYSFTACNRSMSLGLLPSISPRDPLEPAIWSKNTTGLTSVKVFSTVLYRGRRIESLIHLSTVDNGRE
jgi:hypothetical protein